MEWNPPVSQGVCRGMSYFKCYKGTVSRSYDNDNVSVFENTWLLTEPWYQYFGWTVLKQYYYFLKTQIHATQQNKDIHTALHRTEFYLRFALLLFTASALQLFWVKNGSSQRIRSKQFNAPGSAYISSFVATVPQWVAPAREEKY
jgi:hypothetical protein